ncbi:hypothetical protein CALVIDRAFT_528901 [Calocera viscosa TUFC12733]|uniref:Uncharacterized protein n=1 Tax=Calocera viscosa (strain TUFC12733) TaxID=1330018 RepID=A0A167KA12_CALVF|nr:hypothetical protein CALVIDRAFT_528901 [Calocera viscosa TUFC12733]
MSSRSYDKERERRESRYSDEYRNPDRDVSRSRQEDRYAKEPELAATFLDHDMRFHPNLTMDARGLYILSDRRLHHASQGYGYGQDHAHARDHAEHRSRRHEESRTSRSQRDEERYHSTLSTNRVEREQIWEHDHYESETRESRYRLSTYREHRNSDVKSRPEWSARRSPTPDYRDSRGKRRVTPDHKAVDAREKRPLDATHTRARSLTPEPSPTRTATVQTDADTEYTDRRSRSPRHRDDDRDRRSSRRRRSSDSDDHSRTFDRDKERSHHSWNGHKDKPRDREREKERDRERKQERKRAKKEKEKEERRSVLTGKKIKLKVHKDADDIERDKKRENLLQFLNSAYD